MSVCSILECFLTLFKFLDYPQKASDTYDALSLGSVSNFTLTLSLIGVEPVYIPQGSFVFIITSIALYYRLCYIYDDLIYLYILS